jgi:hypothetical protein
MIKEKMCAKAKKYLNENNVYHVDAFWQKK